jgi:uncharacterized protein YraI
MKRWLLLVIVTTLTAFPAYGSNVTVDSPRDGFVALRSEPTVQTGVRLAKIPHATALTLGECRSTADNDIWCRTSYRGKTGWISKRYVAAQHETRPNAEPCGGTWRIGPEGFGPITFGMAQDEAEKLLGQKLEHNDSWSDQCFFSHVNVPGGTGSLQVKGHRVVMVATDQYDLSSGGGGGIATTQGIRVGDTLAQVDKAYRGLGGFAKELDRGIEGDYPAIVYWDSRSNRGISFEYDQGRQRVMGIRAGARSIYARHEGCY